MRSERPTDPNVAVLIYAIQTAKVIQTMRRARARNVLQRVAVFFDISAILKVASKSTVSGH